MKDRVVYLKGRIVEHAWDEGDAIAVEKDNGDYDFVSEFFEELTGECVSVNYYISDENKTREELQENFIKKISGCVDAGLSSSYSEVTGFLWVNDDCVIGGHDLVSELSDSIDKYIDMEIVIHNKEK